MNEQRPPRRPPSAWLLYLVAAIAVGGLIYALATSFPDALAGGDAAPHLTYLAILLIAIAGSALFGRRLGFGKIVKYALAWVGIGALLILAYSFRSDVEGVGNRIYGELRPDKALMRADGSVTIRRSGDGHFRLSATVDGTQMRFLVDTGATLIALTLADAQRLGFDPDKLRYGLRTATANGVVMSARVSLGEIVAGPIRARDVSASVSRAGLGESLLGLSFLDRLSGYEVQGNTMILKP